MTNFIAGPSIISGFGFDTNTTTLLSMVPGACAAIGTMVTLVVIKYTNRTVGGIFTILLGCIGIIMMLAIPESYYTARYGGYILTMQCTSLQIHSPASSLEYLTDLLYPRSKLHISCPRVYHLWCRW